MTAPTSPTQGQAPEGQQPQAGTPAQPPPAGSGQTQPPKPSYQFASQQEAEEAFLRMVAEKSEANKEAQKVAAKLKAFEDAQLSAQEKATKERDDALALAKAAQQRAARADVKVLAQQLGFAHPEDAIALIEAKLQIDDTGTASNAKALLDALKKDRPEYVGQQTPQLPNVSPTNPGSLPGQPFFTKAQLEDFDFYLKHEADIKKARREGRVEI